MNREEYFGSIQAYQDNCLEHYGVLGMKWGIRRYQNPDGSLTEYGKQHYAKAEKVISKWNEKKMRAIARGDKEFAKKNLDMLSNEEIQKFNDRIRARTTVLDMDKQVKQVKQENFKNWLNTASTIINTGANMAENGTRLYNAVAKINNTCFPKGKKMPIIGEKKEEDRDKWTSRTVNYKDSNGRNVTEVYGNKKG